MIENKDVKIAENKNEASWIGIEEKAKKNIQMYEMEIDISKAIIKLAKRKQKKSKKPTNYIP